MELNDYFDAIVYDSHYDGLDGKEYIERDIGYLNSKIESLRSFGYDDAFIVSYLEMEDECMGNWRFTYPTIMSMHTNAGDIAISRLHGSWGSHGDNDCEVVVAMPDARCVEYLNSFYDCVIFEYGCYERIGDILDASFSIDDIKSLGYDFAEHYGLQVISIL